MHNLHDSVMHLENDMSEFLHFLQDDITSEIILNPYKKNTGTYEGHILIEQNSHLQNAISCKTDTLPDYITTIDAKHVIYKTSHKSNQILFWSKLSDNLFLQKQQLAYTILANIDVEHNIIRHTEDASLLKFADDLLDGYIGQLNISNAGYDELIVLLNQSDALCDAGIELHCAMLHEIALPVYPGVVITTQLIKLNAVKAETIISMLASISGKFIHNKSPQLECKIPKYGHRFTGLLPPVVPFPAFCIRKHLGNIYTLKQLVDQGVIDQQHVKTIQSWIKRKLNILIAGGTGSGKTTLANAILQEMCNLYPADRAVIIEDTAELKFDSSRSISMLTNEYFSVESALRSTLRFRPDRIIMGEVRGYEAYTLLKLWNTGHPGGLTTIHANGVDEAILRFESCIADHPSTQINRKEIGLAINGIISIQTITEKSVIGDMISNVKKRVITGLQEVIGYDDINNIYQSITYYRYE